MLGVSFASGLSIAMSRLSFESAEVLVYDPVSANRNATRATLYTLGFRKIDTVSTIEAMLESVQRRPPDLAMCEVQGNDTELCSTVQDLRQGIGSYNPFIVVIVTAWEQSGGLISRVLNSGADDLLLRPFSTSTLGARIRCHIEHRKGFVITSDYVGPDRRRDSQRPSNTELFRPPNSLKMRTQERLMADEATQRLDRDLKKAREVLTAEKLRRDSFQLCVLWRLMQRNPPATESYQVDAAKMNTLTRSIARRCVEAGHEKAGSLCESVLAAIEGLEAGVDRNASMHLLGHSALGLVEVFDPGKNADQHLRAIDATVALVEARMTTALAS
jgi:DNA-binding response OmpR family regulator